MFRNLMIAAAATVALGAAALAPTAASAGWHGGGHHGHHGGHWGGGYGFGYGVGLYNTYEDGGCYVVKKVVDTSNGPRVRRVTVCN